MMDGPDLKLIALLRADARASITELARAVGLSRGAVQNRIDRLIARGDILGFTVKVHDREQDLGVRAMMGIAVEGESAASVIKALRGVTAVEAIHMTNGRWDMVAELRADTLTGFSHALDAIRRIKGISASETNLLLETYRF